jgi:CDP-diacylglycerol--glycerol-3-phosphate 3-phosphatidyltransferase|uniref:CDP-alcohol phosphatidyltransferase family protein n=1 Tax=candidate division WOR-3 bacterium TaxID=2052148 RepID=A0A7C6EDG3_UNCW3
MREAYKSIARKPLQPIVQLLIGLKISPNLLTILSLPISVIVGYFFALGRFPIAGALLLLVGFFDTVDGEVARKSNRINPKGAFLDSTIDRISEFLVFLGIFIFFRENPKITILIFITFFASLLVSYIRARAQGIGNECNTGIFERPVRFIILVLGSFFLTAKFFPIVLWLIFFGCIFTIFQRLYYVLKK